MLCQKCHKNLATVRYAEVVDGQVTDQHLCADCLAKHQLNAATGFELAGPAPGLHRPSGERVIRESMKPQPSCSACGVTMDSITEKAQVGCPACFEQFGGQIESMLEGMHWALQHKGKSGKLDDTRVRLRADLQAKRALLRSVLRAENYEEAARLRDEIRSLEEGLNMADSGAD